MLVWCWNSSTQPIYWKTLYKSAGWKNSCLIAALCLLGLKHCSLVFQLAIRHQQHGMYINVYPTSGYLFSKGPDNLLK